MRLRMASASKMRAVLNSQQGQTALQTFQVFHISCDHASSFKRFQGETPKNMFLATSGCSEGRQEEDIGLSCLGAIIPQGACGT